MASSKRNAKTGHTVKVGSVRVHIFPWRHPAVDRIYWRFRYTPPEGGRAQEVTRADRMEAIEEANRIARQIHNGYADLAELPAEKLRMIRAFLDLNPTWADLQRWGADRLGSKITLQEAIDRFYQFKVKENNGKVTPHIKLTKKDVENLALDIGADTPLARVKADQIAEWLDDLPVQEKRKKDYRAACVALWRWARRQELIVVTGELTEPEKLPVPQVSKKDKVDIPSLEEWKFLLTAVRPDMLPWLVCCGLSGIRSGEIRQHGKEPLDVSAIKLARRIIDVPASISKNRKRKLIPISDTLALWLKVCKLPKSGPIIPEPPYLHETFRLGELLREKFKRTEGWPPNCLRHLYGSVRVAETHDVAKVAYEMDNSPNIIRDHYLEAMTPREAAAYLRVHPQTKGVKSRK